MTATGQAESERALILAPNGRDAIIAAALLREAGIAAQICPDIPALVHEIGCNAGFAVVTEEAFRTADLKDLAGWIANQLPWSDFPFVLLTERGGGTERNPAAERLLGILGNVTFLERPFLRRRSSAWRAPRSGPVGGSTKRAPCCSSWRRNGPASKPPSRTCRSASASSSRTAP